jgi:hypothetical protein
MRARSVRLLALVVALTTPAAAQMPGPPGGQPMAGPQQQQQQQPGDQGQPPPEAPPKPSWTWDQPLGPWPQQVDRVTPGGYLLPQFELVSLPTALPRDQLAYGARGTRVGFAIGGTPYEQWSYMAHVVLVPAGTENLAVLEPTQNSTANTPAGVIAPTQNGTLVTIEEISVSFRPLSFYRAKIGFMRIPFTVGQQVAIPKQMFPIRPAATIAFQSGADEGFLNTLAFLDGRIQGHFGVFDGSSLGALDPQEVVRGPVIGGSLETHPLGLMPLREGDQDRGPPRFALGVGALYRSASAFDTTGYEATTFKDTRFALSGRASWYGLYLQGEFMKRVRADNLSDRPAVSTGGYGEASFYFPVSSVAFSPLVRYNALSVDQDFSPRTFTSFEVGLGFYPYTALAEPDRLRIIIEYLGANVKPQNESQKEGLIQIQLVW